MYDLGGEDVHINKEHIGMGLGGMAALLVGSKVDDDVRYYNDCQL